jgi:hypothetical protein
MAMASLATDARRQILFFEEFLPWMTGDTIVAWRGEVAVGHIVVMSSGATARDRREGHRAGWDLSIGTYYRCGASDSVEEAKESLLEAFEDLCEDLHLDIGTACPAPSRWRLRGIVLKEDVERLDTYERAERFMRQEHIKRIVASLDGDPEWPAMRRAIWAHMQRLPKGDEDGDRQASA